MTAQTVNPLYLLLSTAFFALLPIIIGLFTSYLKMSIVFGMLRSGLGTQQVPGPIVVMAMSLALTSVTMSSVFSETASRLFEGEVRAVVERPSIEGLRKILPAFEPWLEFLRKHSGRRELLTFSMLSSQGTSNASGYGTEPEKVPLRAVLPAFVLTEIKESFAMAFVLLLPFLVIDLIVANILAGMGMFMVSPAMIALPLKLLLFVAADGWLLLGKSLVGSYALPP